MMISKELLSNVMKMPISNNINEKGITRVVGISEQQSDGSLDLDFGYQGLESSHCRYINIYQLLHKCKEWLLDEGYYIKISPFKVELFEKDTNCFMRDFYSPIQSKSIPYDIIREIKACQWILENKETK